MISFNKLAGYRVCCTSTSSTTDILLKNDYADEMYIGKYYKINEKILIKVLDSN